MRIFTDLNLNGRSPARVQPRVGEWGPTMVPSTASKKRTRIWASLALVAALVALFWVGHFFYTQLTSGMQ